MTRHIVARTTEIPPGGNKVVGIDGRDIVVFHVNGEYFALLNRCPHAGAPLDKGAGIKLFKKIGDRVESGEPLYRIYAFDQSEHDLAAASAKSDAGYAIARNGQATP